MSCLRRRISTAAADCTTGAPGWGELQEQLVDLVRSCGDLEKARRVHALVRAGPLSGSRFLSNLIIQMYGKCGDPQAAGAVFETIQEPNKYSWTILIAAYAQNGHLAEARRLLLFGMPRRNLMSWTSVLQAYAQAGHLTEAVILFERMPCRDWVSCISIMAGYGSIGAGYKSRSLFDEMPQRNALPWNVLISAYAESGDLVLSKKTFDKMPVHDAVCYNTMISAYSHVFSPASAAEHSVAAAEVLFQQMPEKDNVTRGALFRVYAQCGRLDEAKAVFDRSEQREAQTWNLMSAAYLHSGRSSSAHDVFWRMPQHSLVSWNTALAAACSDQRWDTDPCSRMEEAKVLFDAMPSRDVFSWTTMVGGYAQATNSNSASAVFSWMPHHNAVSWNAVIAAFVHTGNVDAVEAAFAAMPQGGKDAVTWSSLLASLAHSGRCVDAVDLFRRMVLDGVDASVWCFTALLASFSRAGRLRDCFGVFLSMIGDFCLEPTAEHYACMVDLLGRSGQLTIAEEVLGCMPSSPDRVVWRAFLGACGTHQDVERGERAARRVLALDPVAHTPFVLMSTMYRASASEPSSPFPVGLK